MTERTEITETTVQLPPFQAQMQAVHLSTLLPTEAQEAPGAMAQKALQGRVEQAEQPVEAQPILQEQQVITATAEMEVTEVMELVPVAVPVELATVLMALLMAVAVPVAVIRVETVQPGDSLLLTRTLHR